MSVEAISWALNLAPLPRDRGGRLSSACKFVLVGLANHAGPDGTGAFPSVATLVRYTGLSERTVRTCLDRLEALRIISPCDPDIVAARIKRADRRPQGWDLSLSLDGRDIPDPAPAVPEQSDSRRSDRYGTPAATAGLAVEVQSLHPDSAAWQVVDNSSDGVQVLHPAPIPGCNQSTTGVQPAQARGAAAAPEPYEEPFIKPPPTPARLLTSRLGDDRGPGGGAVGEFFDRLGEAWRLTATQRARLGSAVEVALGAGWTPATLASFTGANTGGVRNPYAVLAARLSPSQLPEPPAAMPAVRPPWCGKCDERTRRREDADGGDAGRCPACHPLARQALAVSGNGLVPDGRRAAVCRNVRPPGGAAWLLSRTGTGVGRLHAQDYGRTIDTLVADLRGDEAAVAATARAGALLPEVAAPGPDHRGLRELPPAFEAGE